MQVDHIIPESLLATPDQLTKVLKMFGLPKDFDLNSYRNWLPAHSDCNNGKRAAIFNPSPLIQLQLQKASEKAANAAEVARQTVSDSKLSKALIMVELAVKQEDIDAELLRPLLAAFQDARQRRHPVEVVLKAAPPPPERVKGLRQNAFHGGPLVIVIAVLAAGGNSFLGMSYITSTLVAIPLVGLFVLVSKLTEMGVPRRRAKRKGVPIDDARAGGDIVAYSLREDDWIRLTPFLKIKVVNP